MPGTGDRELHAPRTEIDRKHPSRHGQSSLKNTHAPLGTGGFLTFCGNTFVSHTPLIVERIGGNTGLPSFVLLLALDLAVRLDAIRAARPGRSRSGSSFVVIELEAELLARRQAEARRHRRARRAARHAAGLPASVATAPLGSFTNVDEVLELRERLAELLRLRDDAREHEQLARIVQHRIVRVLRRQVEDRGDQLRVRHARRG